MWREKKETRKHVFLIRNSNWVGGGIGGVWRSPRHPCVEEEDGMMAVQIASSSCVWIIVCRDETRNRPGLPSQQCSAPSSVSCLWLHRCACRCTRQVRGNPHEAARRPPHASKPRARRASCSASRSWLGQAHPSPEREPGTPAPGRPTTRSSPASSHRAGWAWPTASGSARPTMPSGTQSRRISPPTTATEASGVPSAPACGRTQRAFRRRGQIVRARAAVRAAECRAPHRHPGRTVSAAPLSRLSRLATSLAFASFAWSRM